jgi:hypothetical protein
LRPEPETDMFVDDMGAELDDVDPDRDMIEHMAGLMDLKTTEMVARLVLKMVIMMENMWDP